jgi:hypothetical protein
MARNKKPVPANEAFEPRARIALLAPLNGEKVAEGRMRGGHAHDFDSHLPIRADTDVTTPHPALSPVRGEGLEFGHFWREDGAVRLDWVTRRPR